jgi:hypothetical protein
MGSFLSNGLPLNAWLVIRDSSFQDTSAPGANGELVTFAFEVICRCTINLEIKIDGQCRDNQVHLGPGEATKHRVSPKINGNVPSKGGKYILHPNTNPSPFGERGKRTSDAPLGFRIHPTIWGKALRVCVDGLICMHQDSGHTDWSARRYCPVTIM